jgi:hypothetical protein
MMTCGSISAVPTESRFRNPSSPSSPCGVVPAGLFVCTNWPGPVPSCRNSATVNPLMNSPKNNGPQLLDPAVEPSKSPPLGLVKVWLCRVTGTRHERLSPGSGSHVVAYASETE